RIDSYPWIWGNGFLVLKVNHLNGQYEVTGYNVPIETNAAGNMNTYITNTAPGDYLAISAIGDARTNVSEALYVTLESLGSQMIRLAQPGQSWAMIAKKGTSGPGMPVIENLTNDSAVVNFLAPLSFGASPGTISTAGIVTPTSWSAFHWRANAPQGTDIKSAFLGVRSNGVADTLRIIPKDSTDIGLYFLNALTSGPTYKTVKLGGLLSTANEQISPLLKDWWVDFVPPADLAVSSRTVGMHDLTVQKGSQVNLPVTVHNIGFKGIDSARVVVSVFDKFNKARPIASAMLDTIPVNGTKSTTFSISTTNFSRRVTLQVNVSPSKKNKDLVPDNNNAYYTFNVVGAATSGIQLFADGVQLMDGDYVASKPKLVVRLPKEEEGGQGVRQTVFYVDNKEVNAPGSDIVSDEPTKAMSDDDLIFTPHLSAGTHELKVRTLSVSSLGDPDTLEQVLKVNVEDRMGILKLYNYPNPFSRDTYFTFVLSGDKAPEELSIRIFTIAGRRIREIVVPQSQLTVGFNRVYWDGRDSDGDELANGYYFYQVSIKGEGKTETSIEKMAKIR
ncbi:MAG: interleukin-like EMT inducer domain-containing protein, partial [Bacteroidota bacterium]